jgi:hypothetical protein
VARLQISLSSEMRFCVNVAAMFQHYRDPYCPCLLGLWALTPADIGTNSLYTLPSWITLCSHDADRTFLHALVSVCQTTRLHCVTPHYVNVYTASTCSQRLVTEGQLTSCSQLRSSSSYTYERSGCMYVSVRFARQPWGRQEEMRRCFLGGELKLKYHNNKFN